MNENLPPQNVQITPRAESGTVTALAVVSLIFGTIGLLCSWIPCVGTMAIWAAIPATICGGVAFYLAKTKGCSIGLPVAAFVVSALGLIISAIQIIAFSSVVKVASDAAEAERKNSKLNQEQIVVPNNAPQ